MDTRFSLSQGPGHSETVWTCNSFSQALLEDNAPGFRFAWTPDFPLEHLGELVTFCHCVHSRICASCGNLYWLNVGSHECPWIFIVNIVVSWPGLRMLCRRKVKDGMPQGRGASICFLGLDLFFLRALFRGSRVRTLMLYAVWDTIWDGNGISVGRLFCLFWLCICLFRPLLN